MALSPRNGVTVKKKAKTNPRQANKTTALPPAPLIDKLSLRKYQREAIGNTRRYVAAFRDGDTDAAALVHMATGTGKTGVIASLARCTPEINSVLVLAPRVALCDQLYTFITKRFFDHLDHKPPVIPKTVKRIEELIEDGEKADFNETVLISTIQMLESMRSANPRRGGRQRIKHQLYERFKDGIDLIIVDEGHYEPALSWSKAVREFELPRALFTATPYRNDLKRFEWTFRYTSHFTLSQATDQNIIRKVEIVKRSPLRNPRAFMEDVLKFYDTEVKPNWPDARVIIRCDSRRSIDQMADVLRDKDRKFVAIHDKYSDSGDKPWQRQSVPMRKEKIDEDEWYGPDGPVFWVHQFKLLEGIDDHHFRLVAIFERLGNDRQVVQQIGRVIRNPNLPEPDVAYVLDHSRGYHERAWNALFKYDDDLVELIRQNPDRSFESTIGKPLQKEFVDKVLDAHPERAYVDRKARTRFSFETFRPLEDLRLPLTTSLLQKRKNFDMQKLMNEIRNRLLQNDRVASPWYQPSVTTRVLIYVAVNNAPFLESSYFLSDAPGVIVICQLENLISFYDSGSMSPLGLPGLGRAARPAYLRKLFSDRKESKLIEIFAKNAQLGNRAVRTRSVSAASLEDTVPGLEDHVQVLTRVTGYSVESNSSNGSSDEDSVKRRYLGFRHGRVVESGERVTLDEYKDWLTETEKVVMGDRRRLTTFSRFANDATDVSDAEATPRNVLLDVYEVLESYKTLENEELDIPANKPMRIEDRCQNVEEKTDTNGKTRYVFFPIANGHVCEVEIVWDRERRRYVLQSPELDKMYVSNQESGGLVGYLNREQSFRVLPEKNGVIYVDGEFYELMLPVGKNFNSKRYHVGRILKAIEGLEKLKDEKGEKCLADRSDWDPNSIFGFISRGLRGLNNMRNEFRGVDLAICDDMGTECADFIVSQKNRVVFIHAKGVGREGRVAHYGAGKLTDVCGQATKNIRYLSMFNHLKPKHVKRFVGSWSSPTTTEGSVKSRILLNRTDCKTADNLWELLHERIQDPGTTREVWMVLGGILSKKRLGEELKKSTPEAVQAVTLLHGTLAAIGSIDAKLRVFCHE